MKALKIVLGVVAGLVLLLVVAAVLVASFFDPNDYKGYATEAFQARTGRTLALDEDLTLSFFPWLAVETGGITIGNAAGFGDQPFATIERAGARVKLIPLLSGQFEIGTVELDGLTLNLARDAALSGNWEDLAQIANGTAPPAPEAPATSAPRAFELAGVRIREGNVYWRENTTELRYTVTGLDVSTGAIATGEPIDLDLAMQLRDELNALTVAVDASASVQVGAGPVAVRDLTADVTVTDAANARTIPLSASLTSLTFDDATQSLKVEGLVADVGGIKAKLRVSGATLLDDPTIEGTVATEPAALAKIFEVSGMPPPDGIDVKSLGDFDLSAAFRFRNEPREIAVSQLNAHLLGMNVMGDAALDGANALKGGVVIQEFAPNESFFALVRPAAGTDVDLTAIDKLAFSTRFDMDLSTGRASFADIKAGALGATINANLDITPSGGNKVYRGAIATSLFSPEAAAKLLANMLSDKIALHELGGVALDARFVYDPQADTATVAPFKAEVFGLSATGNVQGRNVSSDPVWSGHAQVAQFSPQALITRFGLPPQPTSDPEALTRATIDTRFTVAKDSGKVENLVLALDDSRITGDFTVAGFQNPKYLFTLAIDRVDADRYLPPKARDAQAGEATAGDIELPTNNTMQMDGQMQIGNLTLAGMSFQDVGSRIVLGGGDAKLESARARLYGGEFAGSFHVKAAGDEPGLSLAGRASDLQLQPLIEALTGEPANFSGTGSFDLNLAGHGRSVIENVQSAAGNVTFDMSGGVIKGFNLGRTLCAAYNVTQRAPAPPEQPLETAYQGIKGTAVVTAGTAQSSDLLARTSFMDINGAGTLELVDQELNYDLDATLTGKIDIPNCETLEGFIGASIPFDISGTVTAPTILPDFSKLAQRVIRDELKDRIQDRLQDRLRDILR